MLDVLYLTLGVPVLGAVVRYLYSRPDARIRRALKRARITAIADAKDGKVVKIVGTLAYAAGTIESPLSLRHCAYYSIVVDDTERSPASEIVREERGVDFYVQDASGMALVRASAGAVAALVRKRQLVTTPLDGDRDVERFMSARGKSTKGVILRKSLRAREGLLEAGARVVVGGLARWVANPNAAGGSYRETPKRLVLEASESLPLFLSDDPSTL